MKQYLETVRKNHPLVHNITNYVTVNDVANMILACGASPIMADEPEEVQEITTICSWISISEHCIKAALRVCSWRGKRRMSWDIR